MQYALQVFETEEKNQFRVIDRDGEPWFHLKDVCSHLGIGNASDAAKRLDDDEKDGVDIIDPMGRSQTTTVINESGLYSLILTSRKSEAKKFKKWVTSEVLPAIRKTGGYGVSQIPSFVKRASKNWNRVEVGHFSIINEVLVTIYGRLEVEGFIPTDRAADGKELRVDVSVGRGFAKWLREHHPDEAENFSYYLHETPEAEVEARQYPNALLPLIKEYIDEVWIPECAEAYFKPRDPGALPHLPKLLPGAGRPAKRLTRAKRA